MKAALQLDARGRELAWVHSGRTSFLALFKKRATDARSLRKPELGVTSARSALPITKLCPTACCCLVVWPLPLWRSTA